MEKEERILEFLETNNQEAIERLISEDPSMEQVAQEYTVILQGFKALAIAKLSDSFSSSTNDFMDNFNKGTKAMQIDALSEKLRKHSADKEKKKEPRVINLNLRMLSIAASFLILITAGIWILSPESNPDLLQQYGQTGISMDVRSEGSLSLEQMLWSSNTSASWDNTVSIYSNWEGEKSIPAQFYMAYAHMQNKSYDEAINNFQNILNEDVALWSDMAELNLGLCKHLNQDEDALPILESIASDNKHSMQRKAKELIKQIKKSDK